MKQKRVLISRAGWIFLKKTTESMNTGLICVSDSLKLGFGDGGKLRMEKKIPSMRAAQWALLLGGGLG
jgi:hypothetical protein